MRDTAKSHSHVVILSAAKGLQFFAPPINGWDIRNQYREATYSVRKARIGSIKPPAAPGSIAASNPSTISAASAATKIVGLPGCT
jgi:hypothetical protein